jgi:hypothetical protein
MVHAFVCVNVWRSFVSCQNVDLEGVWEEGV